MSKKKLLYLVVAGALFAFMILIGYGLYVKYQVYTKGKIVEVTITNLPQLSGFKSGFMDFEMNGKILNKRVNSGNIAGLYVGEKIKLKYLKGEEYITLFPNENPMPAGFLLIGMLAVFGILSLRTAFQS